ncbi:hypothetical protein [Labrys wisconsinensis]|uniref:Transcriptional regulator n=1 Tax=Labrys wisconsinensis TaxID=425677 RepID=A0ABU0JA84_9HYPH|nr:hypothetical protein [Labrys wisconsinensis]MDQ0471173.1 hypothetical protein [Labrys wisconsinensis]
MSTDYFPPIQRAVQKLSPNTLDARRALYDKARAALLKQLRSADPALTETQITKERLLLEDAIRRIETDMLRPETAERVLGSRPQAPAPAPPPERLDERRGAPEAEPGDHAPPEADEPIAPMARRPNGSRGNGSRPPAPRRSVATDGRNKRFAILGGAALVLILVAGGAVTMFSRDTDEALQPPAQAVPTRAVAEPDKMAASGKMTERLGAPATAQPAAPAPTPAPPPQQQAAVPAPAETPASSAAQPLAPAAQSGTVVAQSAILYEEQPDSPNRGQAFQGTVTWRTESVSSGTNAPIDTAIKGDLDIPERKLKATITLRRNIDPALPATHTLEIQFVVPPDFPNGGISNIPGVLMKPTAQQRGQPLAGLSVKVTNGFFLVGLSDAPADKGRNAQLLKEREWIDMPLLYDNGRRAILTLEKGVPGDRAFNDAFSSWESAQNAPQQ